MAGQELEAAGEPVPVGGGLVDLGRCCGGSCDIVPRPASREAATSSVGQAKRDGYRRCWIWYDAGYDWVHGMETWREAGEVQRGALMEMFHGTAVWYLRTMCSTCGSQHDRLRASGVTRTRTTGCECSSCLSVNDITRADCSREPLGLNAPFNNFNGRSQRQILFKSGFPRDIHR